MLDETRSSRVGEGTDHDAAEGAERVQIGMLMLVVVIVALAVALVVEMQRSRRAEARAQQALAEAV